MAGKIHPSDAPRSDNRAEVIVWEALKEQLPDGWEAWHSLKIRTPRRQFGETDFIVADPGRGFLVVEVKGTAVREDDGRWWYGTGEEMKQPPLAQAHGYGQKLEEELDRVWQSRWKVPWGVACCLPETPAENRPTNSDTRDLIIDAIEVGDIVPALRRAFDAKVIPGNAPPDASWLDALTQLWGESWEPRVGLLGRARLDEKRRDKLNEQQLAAVRGLEGNQRVLVSGGAGTGKSTVAMHLALEKAWAGTSVCYLCFTMPLARWADAGLALARDAMGVQARALTINGLAVELASEWGLNVPHDPKTSDEWTAVLAAVAGEPADRTPERPALLIIDEGQSFSEADWAVVDRLWGPDTVIWIFRDRAQAFWGDRAVPDRYVQRFVQYRLQHQERMPRSLAALARAYAGGTAAAAAEAHDPDAIRVVACEDAVEPALARQLDELLALGFHKHQIGIITLVGQAASQIFGNETIGSHRVVHADDPDAPKRIVLETFLRFQGLDRAVLLLCEGHLYAARKRYPERMHMALTRASTGVVILAHPDLWQRDEVLSHLREAGKLDL